MTRQRPTVGQNLQLRPGITASQEPLMSGFFDAAILSHRELGAGAVLYSVSAVAQLGDVRRRHLPRSWLRPWTVTTRNL